MEPSRSTLLLLLVFASAVPYLNAGDLPAKFRDYIMPICYYNDFINGQEHPLAQTMDNFIGLVEKLEFANPELNLNEVVGIFLKNYTHDNIVRRPKGAFDVQSIEDYQEKYVSRMRNTYIDKVLAPHDNPFTNDEICMLYYMLSHTVNTTSLRNDSLGEQNLWTKQPRELGLVAVGTTKYSVAVGRVILGLYLGLNAGEGQTLANLVDEEDMTYIPDDQTGLRADPLTILTVGEALVMGSIHDELNLEEARGIWIGMHRRDEYLLPSQEANEICPTIYKLPTADLLSPDFYTVPVLHGAIDGYILGSHVREIFKNSANHARLSQLLRMYYSSRGIKDLSLPNQKPLSFCYRKELVEVDKVKQQIAAFAHLTVFDALKKAKLLQTDQYDLYVQSKTLVPESVKECAVNSNGAATVNLSVETPIDLLVVLDTSHEDKYIELQQQIVGILGNSLNLSRNGSSMTVLLDSGADRNGYLNEFLPKTHSSACIACHAIQYKVDKSGSDPEYLVIQALDKLLNERKGNDSSKSGAPGKVVVYFNFDDENKYGWELDAALKKFRMNQHDVRFFAVGKNDAVLSKYAANKITNCINAIDIEPGITAATLSEKVNLAPASLQYQDCKYARDESNAIYEGFVSPNALQRWEMHPKYFVKSFAPRIYFEVNGGKNIKVCQSRATTTPDLHETLCHSTNSTVHRIPFEYHNPCQRFHMHNCEPIYFTVIGLPDSENGDRSVLDQYCTDGAELNCKTLDQIRFTVSHEGVRCSGCQGLLSSSFIVLLMLILIQSCFARNC